MTIIVNPFFTEIKERSKDGIMETLLGEMISGSWAMDESSSIVGIDEDQTSVCTRLISNSETTCYMIDKKNYYVCQISLMIYRKSL